MAKVNFGVTPKQSEFLQKEIFEIVNWYKNFQITLPPRILVTGASGFLGQWVFASLIAIAKHLGKTEVLCESSRYVDIANTWGFKNTFVYKKGEMQEKFDLIFDLALPRTGPQITDQLSQARDFYSNIIRYSRLILPGGRLIHPSSGAVYGDLRFTDILCELNESSPRNLSIYGEAKLGIESLADIFSMNEIELITPRIFSVFGPLMRVDSPLIGNQFIRSAAEGRDLSAKLSRNVYRDFAYITDIVKQLLFIGTYGSNPRNINLGTSNILEISEFGLLISKYANVGFDPGGRSIRSDNYYGCLHLLEELNPSLVQNVVPVSVGIQKSIEFYRNS